MSSNLEAALTLYAELVVKVALNLRQGQRLVIIGPLAYGGLSFEAAPLVREVTEAAYHAGATYVESLLGHEWLTSTKYPPVSPHSLH